MRRWIAVVGWCVVASLAAVLSGPGFAAAATPREEQWWYRSLQFPQVWQHSRGAGVTIAVIDSGVDPSVPDMRGATIAAGPDYCPGDPGSLHDADGHGTGVAAMAVAQGHGYGDQGIVGLAPAAHLVSIKVDSDADAGQLAPPICGGGASFAAAIRYAADHAQIMSISVASFDPVPSVEAAIGYALDKGVIVAAAAGNTIEGFTRVAYPAAYPGVLAVSGTDPSGVFSPVSVSGGEVVVAAPCDRMVTPEPAGDPRVGASGYSDGRGTSLASPLVAAEAALIWSRWPKLSSGQVIRQVITTATHKGAAGRNDQYGFGVMDPLLALTRSPDRLATSNPLRAAPPPSSAGSTSPATTGSPSPSATTDSASVTAPATGSASSRAPAATPTSSNSSRGGMRAGSDGRMNVASNSRGSAIAIVVIAVVVIALIVLGLWVSRHRRRSRARDAANIPGYRPSGGSPPSR